LCVSEQYVGSISSPYCLNPWNRSRSFLRMKCWFLVGFIQPDKPWPGNNNFFVGKR
jgi:hypothetical protein